MSTALSSASITATSALTSRTLAARWSDVINVKEYGAKGDGVTDDAASIQAALNAAFGSTGNPNGSSARYSNKPVFFPAGNYMISTQLAVRSVTGGVIYGSGSQSTKITYNGTVAAPPTTTNVFYANGFSYSRIEGLSFDMVGASSTSVCVNLDWDNTGSAALNANRIIDVATANTTTGILIGTGGFMGSEMSAWNCTFDNHPHAGWKTNNGNALADNVYNCYFNGCSTVSSIVSPVSAAIMAEPGSTPCIFGCTFNNSPGADILFDHGDGLACIDCTSYSSYSATSANGPNFGLFVCMMYVANLRYNRPNAFNSNITLGNGDAIFDNTFFNGGIFRAPGDHTALALRGTTFTNSSALTGVAGIVENI